MVEQPRTLEQALQQFDRDSLRDFFSEGEKRRQEIHRLFPRDSWPTLPLDRYALGLESADTFCRWLEFRSQNLGSIRGGSARKLLIYKRGSEPGWYFDKAFGSEQEAWTAVRQGFVDAIAKAEAGDWNAIDEIAALQGGPALRLKTLHVYFPDEVLPIYSQAHLKHYMTRLGSTDANQSSLWGMRLNRALLGVLRENPVLANWSTNEMQRFLYFWADPREARRIVKIAPGPEGKYWEECREGGMICVGWDDLEDLSEFETKEAFKKRFAEVFSHEHGGNKSKITQKANELWTLRELEPGDLVIANKGISRILAIGEVEGPGYEFRPDRSVYKHTVHVDWDTSYATDIDPQKRWAFVTVAKVPTDLYESIARRKAGTKKTAPVDPLYGKIGDALERKGQVILYGPPGTGKTYTARRVVVWWLLQQAGHKTAQSIVSDHPQFLEAERGLSTIQVAQRVWWVVTNPEVWNWAQLKSEETVEFDYGRLQRNFPLVQPGDLVIGYQSTPDKRIVALARVSRGLAKAGDQPPRIELSHLQDIDEGLTYRELIEDPILSQSEPMRFRNQGTLFSLNSDQAGHVLAVLAERDPKISQHVGGENAVGPLTRLTFHASYSYEDFVEGFKPVDAGGAGLTLRLEDGVFKRVCREAQANPEQKYLVLIDEINRANVAKVLGELITLLEKDKRGLIVTLPQSKESFSIPPNVFLLGTMNTADRSIKLLDAALRRRFAFIELMPDVELLQGAKVGGLFLSDFLSELNSRIAGHVGREKQIGHSFLMDGGQPIGDTEEFARRFCQEILPLLQEYCYDDYSTLARYLGDQLVDSEGQSLNDDLLGDPESLLGAIEEEFAQSSEEPS